jgi:hypothetical protein
METVSRPSYTVGPVAGLAGLFPFLEAVAATFTSTPPSAIGLDHALPLFDSAPVCLARSQQHR